MRRIKRMAGTVSRKLPQARVLQQQAGQSDLVRSSLPIYIGDRYQQGPAVAARGIARIFTHGRSQAVRLPREFRLPGDRVRVRRIGRAVLLEPLDTDLDAWFAELDRFADVPFMEEGRQQPSMPPPKPVFE
jgi:antitoxin VapB